jgi:hypothetical protein
MYIALPNPEANDTSLSLDRVVRSDGIVISSQNFWRTLGPDTIRIQLLILQC